MTFGFEHTADDSIEIDADSGWPVLSTEEFRNHRRIPEYYEETVIADSLNRSVLEVQQQINNYIAKGNTDVSFTLIDGVPQFSQSQESVYRCAVYARSHSDLMGYFSAVDQKEAGNNKAEDVEQQNQILAQSNRSIRLLLGLGRAGVHSL
ncbi:head completion/stabilization protein [Pseudoalteromonas sp. 2CM39R]|uniref:head completion/stabilization protein n=1 Tax=Pseudoalteromonas sp. 2CM39R TaxID=2929856 RepID=UPI0020C12A13|nr:head completion/stabilization protein [Pseudoalteromonas sp. 2CM39R]MCK8124641.1 head completion/stabilization protein [Pseudoalteromonas sp. 2CM39R]